ncbi:helix-turn-helix domain-containing protein [Streptoalloteichus hindustanus]|uniref:Helix-turn-helix domain-containing protein n=1 Tax=Streptoalloteichus hindustanus TaxID=2017 RepID=A0A1M4YSK1_STRHI|nr:helix-turn-helix transcriptional regulator [Streptoalloteichus hindustanus]SHF08764.1 Helix-turn-helix domain-containing protein [Streptoalloteichus hindustanus]
MQNILSPAVARRWLSHELRRLREATGKKQTEAAARIGITQPALAHLESGTSLPSLPTLEVLLGFYGRPDLLPRMTETLSAAKRKTNGPISSTHDFELFVALEYFATRMHAFEATVITGLLQTPAYAFEIIRNHAETTRGVDVRASVELRMQRKEIIHRADDPIRLWVVMDEPALRRPVGPPKVMAEQLDFLLEESERSNIEIQVVPLSTGPHAGLFGSFMLLEFDDGNRMAYYDTRRAAHYQTDPSDVADYVETMSRLQITALDQEKSRLFIHQMKKELST